MKGSWPIGGLLIYRDKLEINTPTNHLTIKLSDIGYIKKELLFITINHHDPNVPKDIDIYGIYLSNSLEQVIREYNLDIELR